MTYHFVIDDFWDVWAASWLKYSFDVFSVFQKTCRSKRFYFLVIILKFEKLQSHISNFGNVRTVLNYLILDGIPELVKKGKNICSAYEDLMEKRVLTCWKTRYFGQQRLQAL